MRVAVLWTRLSGYLNACLRELAGREGIDLLVIHEAPGSEAPFEEDQFRWMTKRTIWRQSPDVTSLRHQLREFSPDILLIAGWGIPGYRRLARELRDKCVRVMIMDNPWSATLKQTMGVWISPYYVRPIADFAWVPGERQAAFAKKLGFDQGSILRGSFSCDQSAFAAVHLQRIAAARPLPRRFLYVGRFSAEKGLDILVQAYQFYRENNPEPWSLVCCGAGPMRSTLEGKEGIQVQGFVQPQLLPEFFSTAGCLILSSTFEPWALVIHEAVSAGLIVLSSETAGAVVHLVQPGYNGFIVAKQDARGLAQFMSRLTAMSDEQLDAMSKASYSLAQQYSPQRWADTLLQTFDSPQTLSEVHGKAASVIR